MKISGHTFLVTGGASGLGAACVHHLVSKGAKVLAADLNEAAGQTLAAKLGHHVKFAKTDVTDPASMKAAIDAAVAHSAGDGLRGVINCAGIVAGQRILAKSGVHPLDSFEKVLRVNVVGTFNTLRLAAEVMSNNTPLEEGERGVIINTSSVAAFDGQVGQAAYAASKGAVASLSLPAARELARVGIRVMAIAPGIFNTPMVAGMPDQVRDSLTQQAIFPQRLGQPEEYAHLVEHILENRMLNGTTIRLDGAVRLQPK